MPLATARRFGLARSLWDKAASKGLAGLSWSGDFVQTTKIKNLEGLLEESLPWAVLATGVFISCCATKNFVVIDMLAAPLQVTGRIVTAGAQRHGQIALPNWFPALDAILETSGGELCTKLREVTISANNTPARAGSVVMTLDFTRVPLRPDTHSFTLTYSPWFRFLAEPANFNIRGRCAAYVAECVRFLCVRNGIKATTTERTDGCDVETPLCRIEVQGMDQLRNLRITDGTSESIFDVTHRRITLDERMFPAAVAAGRALLATSDRLDNLELSIEGPRMKLAFTGTTSHV